MQSPSNDIKAPIYIALNSELAEILLATLEATRLELLKVQQMARSDDPLTLKQAAEYLHVSRQTVSTYCNQGAITPSEYGNRVWILRSELEAFLQKHKRR